MSWLTRVQLREILERHTGYDPPVYVETGLHQGDRIAQLERFFAYVEGVELDPLWFEYCRVRFEDLDHVTIHAGDSLEVLPRILDARPGCPHFVHLDAHFCLTAPAIEPSDFPLWGELAILVRRRAPTIVSIDDVHTFGRERDDIPGNPWKGVTVESILDFLGDQVLDSEVIGDAFHVWLRPFE